MAKKSMATEEITAEIERLKKSPYVKFAKDAENRALRQRLYNLRSLDKRGRKLAEVMGIKLEPPGGEG